MRLLITVSVALLVAGVQCAVQPFLNITNADDFLPNASYGSATYNKSFLSLTLVGVDIVTFDPDSFLASCRNLLNSGDDVMLVEYCPASDFTITYGHCGSSALYASTSPSNGVVVVLDFVLAVGGLDKIIRLFDVSQTPRTIFLVDLLSINDPYSGLMNAMFGAKSTAIGAAIIIIFLIGIIVGVCICRKKCSKVPLEGERALDNSPEGRRKQRRQRLQSMAQGQATAQGQTVAQAEPHTANAAQRGYVYAEVPRPGTSSAVSRSREDENEMTTITTEGRAGPSPAALQELQGIGLEAAVRTKAPPSPIPFAQPSTIVTASRAPQVVPPPAISSVVPSTSLFASFEQSGVPAGGLEPRQREASEGQSGNGVVSSLDLLGY